jgi:hypothetical protein
MRIQPVLIAAALFLGGAFASAQEPPTAFGFFPSPPQLTEKSVLETFAAMGFHGELALIQRNVPWKGYASEPPADQKEMQEIGSLSELCRRNRLEMAFVVDPLNGLNRRQFLGLPFGWRASFADPRVRAAMTRYALDVVRRFHPARPGIGSEINTYANAYPADFPAFVSLYKEIYARVKAEAPEMRVFTTFQWEEMNNVAVGTGKRGPPYAGPGDAPGRLLSAAGAHPQAAGRGRRRVRLRGRRPDPRNPPRPGGLPAGHREPDRPPAGLLGLHPLERPVP